MCGLLWNFILNYCYWAQKTEEAKAELFLFIFQVYVRVDNHRQMFKWYVCDLRLIRVTVTQHKWIRFNEFKICTVTLRGLWHHSAFLSPLFGRYRNKCVMDEQELNTSFYDLHSAFYFLQSLCRCFNHSFISNM